MAPKRIPPQQRHENTKQTILKAALTLINKKGINNFSLREIARYLEYSPASLYEYVGNKDEIVAELRVEGLKRLRAYLGEASPRSSPPKRLIEIGLLYLKFARDNSEYYRLIFIALPSKRKSISAPIPQESPYRILVQVIEQGIEEGSFLMPRGYDAENFAYGLWSLVHGMAMLQNTHLRDFEADFDSTNRRVLETFVKGHEPKSRVSK